MQPLSKLLIYCIVGINTFFFLQSCHLRKTPATTPLEANHYLGIWRSVKISIPFTADLQIDSHYNYAYWGGACEASFESFGVWSLSGDTLVLNSTYPQKCCYIGDFGFNCEIIDVKEQINRKRRTSIEDCIPEYTLDEYLLFNNEKFIIRDSILTHIPHSDNSCPDITQKFIFHCTLNWDE